MGGNAISGGGDPSTSPVAALLWDEGTLTRESLLCLSGFLRKVTITAGSRQAQLQQALETGLTDADLVAVVAEQPVVPAEAIRLAERLARDDQEAGVPLGVLVAGTPFDAQTWVEELVDSLAESNLEGLIVLVPGPPGSSLTTVALTEQAAQYAVLLRNGLAESLGGQVAGGGPVPVGSSVAIETIRSQTGHVALVFATKAYQTGLEEPPHAPIGAADVVHVIMTDTGMEVTNRTGMVVEMRIHLGPAGGEIAEVIPVRLSPRDSRFFGPGELGVVGTLDPPKPELREWSHEAAVVYEGGDRRIHRVEIRYLTADDATGPAVVGEDVFGSRDGVVAGTISTEIAQAIGVASNSVGRRLSYLAMREDWRRVLVEMVRS